MSVPVPGIILVSKIRICHAFSFSDTDHEILSLRTTVIGPSRHAKLVSDIVGQMTKDSIESVAQSPTWRVFDDEQKQFVEMPVYGRYKLPAGFKFENVPAVIEELDSTTYVPSDWSASLDGA
jgi:N-methylhydantoinase A/oxoprolinase/acetone carboxylase beta subunit